MEILLQLLAGLVGGNAVGFAAKNLSLGTIANSVIGMIGGFGGGQLINMLTSGDAAALAGEAAAASGGLDIGALLGGGAGGAVLVAVAGLVKKMMAKA